MLNSDSSTPPTFGSSVEVPNFRRSILSAAFASRTDLWSKALVDHPGNLGLILELKECSERFVPNP